MSQRDPDKTDNLEFININMINEGSSLLSNKEKETEIDLSKAIEKDKYNKKHSEKFNEISISNDLFMSTIDKEKTNSSNIDEDDNLYTKESKKELSIKIKKLDEDYLKSNIHFEKQIKKFNKIINEKDLKIEDLGINIKKLQEELEESMNK